MICGIGVRSASLGKRCTALIAQHGIQGAVELAPTPVCRVLGRVLSWYGAIAFDCSASRCHKVTYVLQGCSESGSKIGLHG